MRGSTYANLKIDSNITCSGCQNISDRISVMQIKGETKEDIEIFLQRKGLRKHECK